MTRPSILISALCLALATPALAQDCPVTLEGSQENPPVSPAGAGSATVVLNSATRQVTVTGSYSGMTSNVTAAHIHGPAGVGVNAGIMQGLTVSGGTSGTISGGGILTVAEFNAVIAGNSYINVHTLNNGGGEIRGQISCTFTLASATTRNGTGVNPNIYTSSDVPQLGQVWDSQVDNTGVQATIMATFLGGPVSVNLPGFGQLLCAPPRIGTQNSVTGNHTLSIPNNISLIGLNLCTQGGTFNSGTVQLANAIDLVIGI